MLVADRGSSAAVRIRSLLLGVVSILILMWPALVNRQPFYFSDTSSYVRAGEVGAAMVLGARSATVWTMAEPPVIAPAASGRPDWTTVRANDPQSGNIMAGRSPYFGVLLWLAWVSSRFWLFVVAQAAIALMLIGLALRCFGLDRPAIRFGLVMVLAFLSPLAVYNGVLLADALCGFGIAALLILASPGVRLAGWERAGLTAILLLSVVSHLTHLVIAAALVGLFVLMALLRQVRWQALRPAVLIGLMAMLAGLGSIWLTARLVEARYGRAPVLVPLLTARLIADGPGRDFIRAGCEGNRFVACVLPLRAASSSVAYLWSRDPNIGTFLAADPERRRRMSQEDRAFAFAVARTYPGPVLRAAMWNTLLQLSDLRIDVVGASCLADPACIGSQFPPAIVRAIAATPSGQDRWPTRTMDAVISSAAICSLLAIALCVPPLRRRDPALARIAMIWIAGVAVAMVVNAFLGGALSEPQNRYQSRMAWLLPLLGWIVLAALRDGGPAARRRSACLPPA